MLTLFFFLADFWGGLQVLDIYSHSTLQVGTGWVSWVSCGHLWKNLDVLSPSLGYLDGVSRWKDDRELAMGQRAGTVRGPVGDETPNQVR